MGRTHDASSFEVGQIAGKIIGEVELSGGDDFVPLRNSKQTLIESPVTHPAQRHTVGGPVVLRLAPWDYVSGRDSRMTVKGADAEAAQGAAVEIRGDDGTPKALVTNDGTVRFLNG